jgi:hypothetical protein
MNVSLHTRGNIASSDNSCLTNLFVSESKFGCSLVLRVGLFRRRCILVKG